MHICVRSPSQDLCILDRPGIDDDPLPLPTVHVAPRVRKKKQQKRMQASVIGFWSHNRVANLLLRTAHLALVGQIRAIKGSVLPSILASDAETSKGRGHYEDFKSVGQEGEGGEEGHGGTIGQSISHCLLRLQSLLVDGKPEGGWKSEGLKALRQEVTGVLGFK